MGLKFAYSKDPSSLKYLSNKKVFGLLGVPFDSTSTYKPGSRFGPLMIRQASYNFENYSLHYRKKLDVPIIDLGDIEVILGDFKNTCRNISEKVQEVLKKGMIPIVLGGEHSITYGVVKTFDLSDVTILHFDAHMDMANTYAGKKFSHATVMRRIYELHPKKIVQIGVRSCTKEEHEFVLNENIKYYTSRDIIEKFNMVLNEINKLDGPFYVTVDIDVLDPGYAPGVGNPTPVGITPYHMEKFIEKIARKKNYWH